jgi:hypothetical protein
MVSANLVAAADVIELCVKGKALCGTDKTTKK